jgi:hypothetical protein
VITVLVTLFVILEKLPGINCTQGIECVPNAECQNGGSGLECTCTSNFYANGGMCVASKSSIKY